MKWLILVIAICMCLEFSTAVKNSDKPYPKKVKNKKPTKTPKSILDEFSSLSEDDKEFIKELDKQFKLHGDQIKIEVESDNSTAKNPKRTIEGELGYGNQNAVPFPRFQFTKPKFQAFPYAQRDYTAFNPAAFGGNGQDSFYHGSVQIQPSRAYEIKETPIGYQTFTPDRRPFQPLFRIGTTVAPTTLSTTPYSTSQFGTTKYQPGSSFSSTPPYPTVSYSTPIYPNFHGQLQQLQQQQSVSPNYGYQPQQQYSEPVIVLKIPGPTKYAAHLQALLQRYLEIRAAEYIKAFEEQDARAAQNQQFYSQQYQRFPQQPSPTYQSVIQSTDYYKPTTKYMVPTPAPTASLATQNVPSTTFASYQQSTTAPIVNIRPQQSYSYQPANQRKQVYSQAQQPKQFSVQIQQPQFQSYQFPKFKPQQQFTAQNIPSYQQSYDTSNSGAYKTPKAPQIPQNYLGSKAEQQEPIIDNVRPPPDEDYPAPQSQIQQQYQRIQQQQQQQQQNEQNSQSELSYVPPKPQGLQLSTTPSTQKIPQFSLSDVLQHRGFYIGKPQTQSLQQQSANVGEQEVDESPEIPEARHQPTYSNAQTPDGAQRDEDQQLFSYDQQEQISDNEPASQPHKVYGPPAASSAPDSESYLPTHENSPRPSHTRIRFNDAKNNDHSSVYPLPPIPSSTPKIVYEKQPQPTFQYSYDSGQQSANYQTEEPVISITQKLRNKAALAGYNQHSVLETDFQGDAPYTQSQFKRLNELINRLKQRSAAILSSTAVKQQPTATTSDDQ